MGNKLKEITYLTVKDLKEHEIILPGIYSKTFEKIAKKLRVDIDNEDIILKDLTQDIDYVNKIVDKTHDNLDTLQESTRNAQKAIVEKDNDSLNEIHQELAVMRDQINSLQQQLFSDPLTEAYNRKWFSDKHLENDNFKSNGFIAFIDLNKFKSINDNYGHIVGDQVLKYLVRFLKAELNHEGIEIIRYAGDEFIVLFDKEKTTVINAEKMLKDVQEKLSKQKLKSSKIDELQFSFSYGMTYFQKGDNVEKILDMVDELMYKNKEANR